MANTIITNELSNYQQCCEFLCDNDIVSWDELKIATYIGGRNYITLLHILFFKTGYRGIGQLLKCEPDTYYTDSVTPEAIEECDGYYSQAFKGV